MTPTPCPTCAERDAERDADLARMEAATDLLNQFPGIVARAEAAEATSARLGILLAITAYGYHRYEHLPSVEYATCPATRCAEARALQRRHPGACRAEYDRLRALQTRGHTKPRGAGYVTTARRRAHRVAMAGLWR